MPEMDGIETVAKIRKLSPTYEGLTIIALTANAVKNARAMFLSNSFNDFIAKPIDSAELTEIVRKYLPPEKIRVKVGLEERKSVLSQGGELLNKAAVTFAKGNQDTFEQIATSLADGDTKTAHRIAHTLKSSAGYLGKKALQKAALSLEQSLQNDPPKYTSMQVENIKKELEKVLKELEPLLKEAESAKPAAVQVDAEKLTALLQDLKPLLEKSDFGAANYVEELQSIAGTEELAARIDDYDFEGALKLLDEIMAIK
jgi:HPt (histidine-containing phosphotransfer) domain-containing protein